MLAKYFLFLTGILFMLIGFLLYLTSKQHGKSTNSISVQRKQSVFFFISALILFLVNSLYVVCNIRWLTAITFFAFIFGSLLVFIILTVKWTKRTGYIPAGKRSGLLKWAFIVLIITALAYFAKRSSRVPAIHIDRYSNNIVIAGRFGGTISLDAIAAADTVSVVPKVERMRGGSGFFISYIGTFELEGEGESRLFVYRGNPPYVKITLHDSSRLYVNFKSSTETYNFYNALMPGK